MGQPTFNQITFRTRDDDGNETGATWRQAQGDNDSWNVDQNYRVRFLIDEQNVKVWSGVVFSLYYDLAGGGYNEITGTSPIQWASTGGGPYYSNNDDCTEQLTGGTGTFVTNNNGMQSGANAVTNSGAINQYFECEFCLTIDSAQVSNDQLITLHIYANDAQINSYVDAPVITVVEATVPTLVIDDAYVISQADTFALTQVHNLQVDDAYVTSQADTFGIAQVHNLQVDDASCDTQADAPTITVSTGQVAYLDFEEGDFTDFDSTANETDMAVNGTAAMVGSYGLDIYLDGNQNITYGTKALSISTNSIRYRVYADFSNLSLGSGDSWWEGIRINCDGSYNGQTFFSVWNMAESGGNLTLSIIVDDDPYNDNFTSVETLSATSHYIEVLITRETYDGANDGTCYLWIDGSPASSNITNLDNYNMFPTIDEIYLGSSASLDATTTGYIYYDDLIIRDDDTEIGPASGPLAVDNAYCISQADNVTLTQVHILQVDDAYSDTQADAFALTQVHNLQVDDAYVTTQSDNAVLTGEGTLSVNDAYCVSQTDNVALTQVHILSVDDAYCETQTDNVVLTGPGGLAVDDAYCISQADNITLTQVHVLQVDDAYVTTQSDNVVLTGETALTVDNVYVTTQADAPVLTQTHILVIADLFVITQADAPALTQVHNLSVDDSYSVSAADNVVLDTIVIALLSAWTLHSRSVAWTVDTRSTDMTLKDRSTAWTVDDR